MIFPVTLLDLAGSIALLLWGMYMVQTGAQRRSGRFSADPQNSAEGVPGWPRRDRDPTDRYGPNGGRLLVRRLGDLVPALAVMLGANVGTTFILQVLSLDVAAASLRS